MNVILIFIHLLSTVNIWKNINRNKFKEFKNRRKMLHTIINIYFEDLECGYSRKHRNHKAEIKIKDHKYCFLDMRCVTGTCFSVDN